MDDARDALGALVALGADPVGAVDVAAELAERYREPWRHYHTLDHVRAVLAALRDLDPERPDVLAVVAWYHDAIYEPTQPDNEARSADLATDQLTALGVPAADVARVADLVRATAGHQVADDDHDGARFLDADLSVLGAPRDRYRAYVAGVRAEFAFVADDAWRGGRAAVLRTFADRPRIFRTAAAHEALDAPTRANLAWELGTLETDAPHETDAPTGPGR